jgi:hypothetical protein
MTEMVADRLIFYPIRTSVRMCREVFAYVLTQSVPALQISSGDEIHDPMLWRVLVMSVPLCETSLDVFAVWEKAFEIVYWCEDFVAGVFVFYSNVPSVSTLSRRGGEKIYEHLKDTTSGFVVLDA